MARPRVRLGEMMGAIRVLRVAEQGDLHAAIRALRSGDASEAEDLARALGVEIDSDNWAATKAAINQAVEDMILAAAASIARLEVA